jgi:hypothetical protein
MLLSIAYPMRVLKKQPAVMPLLCQTMKSIDRDIKIFYLIRDLCQRAGSKQQWGVQEMLQHIIVLYLVKLKTQCRALWGGLLKPLRLCVEGVELVLILVGYALVVIVLYPLTLLLVALSHSWVSMMRYVKRLCQRGIDEGQ